MGFLKKRPIMVELKSWYKIRGTEQGFWHCFADGLNRGLSYICYTGYRILGVLMRYVGSRINGVGSGIGRVGSGIIASGSEITSHWDWDQQFFEGSAIRLRHFGGIRDQNWSCFWNQGSEIWVQKWGQQ